jgi:hypothetical protein
MLSGLEADGTEHKLVPIMKLIDFDQAHIATGNSIK